MRYLGIDYGEKRVGIALSDEAEGFAFPFAVLKNDRNLSAAFKNIVEKEKVAAFVVGLPFNFKGEKTKMSKKIEDFSSQLKETFHIPVFFENEVLTTKVARQIQGETASLDASSAALILESFLQRKRREL